MRLDTFPDIQKKWNIIPANKKGDRQQLGNYRQVSLLTANRWYNLWETEIWLHYVIS